MAKVGTVNQIKEKERESRQKKNKIDDSYLSNIVNNFDTNKINKKNDFYREEVEEATEETKQQTQTVKQEIEENEIKENEIKAAEKIDNQIKENTIKTENEKEQSEAEQSVKLKNNIQIGNTNDHFNKYNNSIPEMNNRHNMYNVYNNGTNTNEVNKNLNYQSLQQQDSLNPYQNQNMQNMYANNYSVNPNNWPYYGYIDQSFKEVKNARITFLLEPSIMYRFKNICKEQKINPSALLREFVIDYINKNTQ